MIYSHADFTPAANVRFPPKLAALSSPKNFIPDLIGNLMLFSPANELCGCFDVVLGSLSITGNVSTLDLTSLVPKGGCEANDDLSQAGARG